MLARKMLAASTDHVPPLVRVAAAKVITRMRRIERGSNAAFIVWRKTAKKRMVAKRHAIKAELRCRRHEPVAEVGAWLRKVVNGYYRYRAVPGDIDRLSAFGQRLRRLWRLVGRRRSQRPVPWDRVNTNLFTTDSSSVRLPSLSDRSFPRHSSKVGAACVEALVRSEARVRIGLARADSPPTRLAASYKFASFLS
jgi:hypothetical protein